MPNFLNICKSEAHCETCRDPDKQAWRDSAAKHYDMPAGWPKCPYGKPMKGEAPDEPTRLYPRRREKQKFEPGMTKELYEQMRKDGLVN